MSEFIGFLIGGSWALLGLWGWSRFINKCYFDNWYDLLTLEICIVLGPLALLWATVP